MVELTVGYVAGIIAFTVAVGKLNLWSPFISGVMLTLVVSSIMDSEYSCLHSGWHSPR
jgi:hypothetical protein